MDRADHDEISKKITEGYLAKDLEPLKCDDCENPGFKQTVKQIDQGHISEFEASCNHCDNILGYWAYGHWQV